MARSNLTGVPIDLVHRKPGSTFTSKTLDDFGVNWARSGRTSDPVIDRGWADVELKREGFHTVGVNEACEFGFPTSPDFPVHRPTPVLVRQLALLFYGEAERGDMQVPVSPNPQSGGDRCAS